MSSVLDLPSVRDAALRLNVEQYHRLCGSGIIPERTELLAGIVVSKIGKSPLHTWTVEFLSDWLRAHLPSNRALRVEQPLTLTDSEPEPDLAMVVGTRDDYRAAHPSTAELVIEVAIATEEIDRAKAAIYAAAAVGEYWLVLPQKRQVVIHRQVDQPATRYLEVSTLDDTGTVSWGDHALSCGALFADED